MHAGDGFESLTVSIAAAAHACGDVLAYQSGVQLDRVLSGDGTAGVEGAMPGARAAREADVLSDEWGDRMRNWRTRVEQHGRDLQATGLAYVACEEDIAETLAALDTGLNGAPRA